MRAIVSSRRQIGIAKLACLARGQVVIPRAMHKIVLVPFMSLVFAFFNSAPAFGATHPATVGQSPDSIAMQLHYPPKEKAAKTQGAVKFYCEVSPQGKPGHISIINGKGDARFGTAVLYALNHGRFAPATVDGKPTGVMVGGTVLFLMTNNKPTIAIALATAESDKIAGMSNYMQPQMLDSDALFRRKIYAIRDKYTFRMGLHPGAVVLVHLDAQGKVVSKKIVSESPENGGRGRVLLDVVAEESFIPAQSNGQAVAGDFELAVDFEHILNPDEGARTGTLIPNDGR